MNKASGGNGIPAELFQILKDDAIKVLHSICQQILKNSAMTTGLQKVNIHSNPKEMQEGKVVVKEALQIARRDMKAFLNAKK